MQCVEWCIEGNAFVLCESLTHHKWRHYRIAPCRWYTSLCKQTESFALRWHTWFMSSVYGAFLSRPRSSRWRGIWKQASRDFCCIDICDASVAPSIECGRASVAPPLEWQRQEEAAPPMEWLLREEVAGRLYQTLSASASEQGKDIHRTFIGKTNSVSEYRGCCVSGRNSD